MSGAYIALAVLFAMIAYVVGWCVGCGMGLHWGGFITTRDMSFDADRAEKAQRHSTP